jgi:hypothetical protein
LGWHLPEQRGREAQPQTKMTAQHSLFLPLGILGFQSAQMAHLVRLQGLFFEII